MRHPLRRSENFHCHYQQTTTDTRISVAITHESNKRYRGCILRKKVFRARKDRWRLEVAERGREGIGHGQETAATMAAKDPLRIGLETSIWHNRIRYRIKAMLVKDKIVEVGVDEGQAEAIIEGALPEVLLMPDLPWILLQKHPPLPRRPSHEISVQSKHRYRAMQYPRHRTLRLLTRYQRVRSRSLHLLTTNT